MHANRDQISNSPMPGYIPNTQETIQQSSSPLSLTLRPLFTRIFRGHESAILTDSCTYRSSTGGRISIYLTNMRLTI